MEKGGFQLHTWVGKSTDPGLTNHDCNEKGDKFSDESAAKQQEEKKRGKERKQAKKEGRFFPFYFPTDYFLLQNSLLPVLGAEKWSRYPDTTSCNNHFFWKVMQLVLPFSPPLYECFQVSLLPTTASAPATASRRVSIAMPFLPLVPEFIPVFKQITADIILCNPEHTTGG